MNDFMAIAVALYLLFIAIQLTYGIYLLRRALKPRAHAFISLFIIYVLMDLDVIVTDLEIEPPIIHDLIMMDYTIFYVLFTKYAFYSGRKTKFRIVLAIIDARASGAGQVSPWVSLS